MDEKEVWGMLKLAFKSNKMLKATYNDGESFDFKVTTFDDSATEPVWTVDPDKPGRRKATDAIKLILIE